MAEPIIINAETLAGGWAKDLSTSNSASVTGGPNQYSRSAGITLFRPGFLGHISPGEPFANITDGSTRVTALPLNGVVASNGETFVVLRGGKLVKFGLSDDTVDADYSPTASTSHAVFTSDYSDVGVFKDANGVEWVRWTWEEKLTGGSAATSADIGRIKIDGTGQDDDWFSTANNNGAKTISSLTRSSQTATATSNSHGYSNGDYVTIAGADQAAYNGTFKISNVAANTFDYTVEGSPATPATTGSSITAVEVSKLEPGVPHNVWTGPDRIEYCTNGQWIASHDPSGTSTNSQAFNLGTGFVSESGCAWNNFSVFIGNPATTYLSGFAVSQPLLYFWKGFSPKPEAIVPIPDNYASRVFNDNGVLKLFTQGRNGTMKVLAYVDGKFETLAETALAGTLPRHGSVDAYRSLLYFANNAAERLMALDGNAFHYTNVILDSSTTAEDVGMVKNLSSNGLYVGLRSGNPDVFSIAKIVGAQYYTPADLRTKVYELPFKSTVFDFEVKFSQFSSSSSVILSLFKGYTTLSIGGANDLLNQTISDTTFPRASTDKVVRFRKSIPDVTLFYMNVRFNHAAQSDTAAIIESITIRPVETSKAG